jgi:toxin FitB
LLDTNVIASLIALNGAPGVKAWAKERDESALFISVLTLGEYDKGIPKLAWSDPNRSRFIAVLDALEERFSGRVLSVTDSIVRRWGHIAGTIHRETGHPPSVIDTMLAATAREHDLCFATRNVRDVEKAGVSFLNPWNV